MAAHKFRILLAAAVLAVGLIVGAPFMAGASNSVGGGLTLGDIAAVCKQQLASAHPSGAAKSWLQGCVSAMTQYSATPGSPGGTPIPGQTSKTARPTTTPTAGPPTIVPTTSPAGPVSVTTTRGYTPPPPPADGVCAAYPAVPDASCTGYKHTGVTLHSCSTNLTANTTYDSCKFDGDLTPPANVTITRSLILGHVDYSYSANGSLLGMKLTDVEIDGTGNADGSASIGNNDYTCIRCNIHGNTRGANVGHNVLIQDSYLHDWYYHDGDHQTGIGSNGGHDNQIIHNWIICSNTNDPTNYGCSSAFSIYGDDDPGNNNWTIAYNRFDSGSSYCTVLGNSSAKPYPATNIKFTNNTFGNMFEAYWHRTHSCSQYGPFQAWEFLSGNVWQNNMFADHTLVTP
jgi:hypothetical protein